VTRAAALDSFDLGVGLCLEASIDEMKLRHALILAVDGTEAALIRDSWSGAASRTAASSGTSPRASWTTRS
jgi:hypothetical protein